MSDTDSSLNLVYELKATVQAIQERQKHIDTNILSMVQSVSKLESNATNINDQLKNNLKLIEHIQNYDNMVSIQLSKLSQQLMHSFDQMNEFKKNSLKTCDEFESDINKYNDKILALNKEIDTLTRYLEASNKRIAVAIKDSNREIIYLNNQLKEIKEPLMELTDSMKGIKFSKQLLLSIVAIIGAVVSLVLYFKKLF